MGQLKNASIPSWEITLSSELCISTLQSLCWKSCDNFPNWTSWIVSHVSSAPELFANLFIRSILLILQFTSQASFEAAHYCSIAAQTFVNGVYCKLMQCLDVWPAFRLDSPVYVFSPAAQHQHWGLYSVWIALAGVILVDQLVRRVITTSCFVSGILTLLSSIL